MVTHKYYGYLHEYRDTDDDNDDDVDWDDFLGVSLVLENFKMADYGYVYIIAGFGIMVSIVLLAGYRKVI